MVKVMTAAILGVLGVALIIWIAPATGPALPPPVVVSTPPAAQRPIPTRSVQPPPSAGATPAPPTPEAGVDPAELIPVAREFAAAWLLADPTERGTRLRAVTTPTLLEGLVSTRPDKIPSSWVPAGDPQVLSTDEGSGQLEQRFTNGQAVVLLIVPNPAGAGWAVASVRPR